MSSENVVHTIKQLYNSSFTKNFMTEMVQENTQKIFETKSEDAIISAMGETSFTKKGAMPKTNSWIIVDK